ncbi:centrosomal protein of 162 kDa-like [Papaver somniferum]|uniref:centrosomal protein of 162 kDa-like n=1 Tax=Papaver somniferum TaxID=3469 RepID=UPI000E700E35|nr:centrosomal protein of 162 kDa-like [Papaver somniferum]
MSSLRRGEGSIIVPHVRSQAIDGVVTESSKGRLPENLSLGSSDDSILEAIMQDSKGPFSAGVDRHHLDISFEVASQLDVMSAQYRAAKNLFFDPDCLRSIQRFSEIRVCSIQEMEAFIDTYADFLPRLSAFSIDVGCTLFKFYRTKCTHLSALLERARQEYSLVSTQKPSSIDAASASKISSLEDDLRKTQRSLEACMLALERDNNAVKVVEDGRKAVDYALVVESSKTIDFEDACASLAKFTAERNVLSSEVCSLKIRLVEAGSASSSMSHASLVKKLEELENVYQVLSSENTSLRIDVDDLRNERDTLVKDLEAAEVDLAEAQHSLEESLNHAGGLQEQLVGENAKINRLEGQISSLEISRQFYVAAKFKAEALQQANDQLSTRVSELNQKLASDLATKASQMKVQFEKSIIDYINDSFTEAERRAEGVVFPRLPYP